MIDHKSFLNGFLLRWLFFWFASFSSIVLLLGHLYAVSPMSRLGFVLGLPASIGMFGIWRWAQQTADENFLLRFKAGLLGGFWGTLGYNIIRIPFHYWGQNPFSPIRAYGMWLAGTSFSTPWTDALGFAYHFSNGITFGWIYSFLFLRRHWAWAVVWGLFLESLAVFSAFGEIFAIRHAYSFLALAYAAHIFYGMPLGWVCRGPEKVLRRTLPLRRTLAGGLTVILFCFMAKWFLTAWQPVAHQPRLEPGKIIVGPNALYPGWADRPLGSTLILKNVLPVRATLAFRRPYRNPKEQIPFVLESGESKNLPLNERGIYQIGFPGKNWRSIFIAVQENGSYFWKAPKRA